MTSSFQKLGGVAALIEAATFVVGIALFSTVLAPFAAADVDPAGQVALLADNQALLAAANIIIYVLFGAVLVVLALALHERLQAGAPALTKTATAFGLIWAGLVIASGMIANIGAAVVVDLYAADPAQASLVWLSQGVVVDGLGGGNEIVGGLWVLLLSGAAWRAGGLPRPLIYLGALVGLAGVVTVVPALGGLGLVFGLGEILWFVWVGIVLLRGGASAAAP